jgi:hypothetical protein
LTDVVVLAGTEEEACSVDDTGSEVRVGVADSAADVEFFVELAFAEDEICEPDAAVDFGCPVVLPVDTAVVLSNPEVV